MQPSGVITITTDFGHKGPFAAVMKGVILGHFPAARIIDLAHDIPAQWPPEAGFWVSRSYQWFPEGTVHLAIVDPGVGTERDILLAEAERHNLVQEKPEPLVHFMGFGDSSLDFRLAVWVDDPMVMLGVASDLRFMILKALAEQNIEIPFPQRDLHLKSGVPWEMFNGHVSEREVIDKVTA